MGMSFGDLNHVHICLQSYLSERAILAARGRGVGEECATLTCAQPTVLPAVGHCPDVVLLCGTQISSVQIAVFDLVLTGFNRAGWNKGDMP